MNPSINASTASPSNQTVIPPKDTEFSQKTLILSVTALIVSFVSISHQKTLDLVMPVYKRFLYIYKKYMFINIKLNLGKETSLYVGSHKCN